MVNEVMHIAFNKELLTVIYLSVRDLIVVVLICCFVFRNCCTMKFAINILIIHYFLIPQAKVASERLHRMYGMAISLI